LSLAALIDEPFELLLALEGLARQAVAARQGADVATEEWIGIGFKLGGEDFVVARTDIREVLPVPEQLTRVPGAKPWLRGIANVRGQLLTVVDLKAFLGAGGSMPDRHSRMLLIASREVPTGLIVDEVTGFKRFSEDSYGEKTVNTVIRCEHYLDGSFQRGNEIWPRFSLLKLLEDEHFLDAGETVKA
jgi:twitching motility protein PilI